MLIISFEKNTNSEVPLVFKCSLDLLNTSIPVLDGLMFKEQKMCVPQKSHIPLLLL